MKKAFDQTVRDIKRGVNKKVLKVPSIEQKVLDATSNEPWGPHGSLLADISQASRNYHEYQMIMSVIWKRVNDTGKNWRHVYKGLTVLEYLVANGSERVVDDIREHAYQISTLSDFQYIDSTGRDQGNNVRKKSQSLVALVNDKERIQEVRQKAAANWDKFHNTSGGGKYRPGSYPGPGYDDGRYEGRYGSRDEDRNGDGREREWGDDKYGRYGDSYSRDGEERYGRDGYRDEESRGRRSVDGDNYGRRSRSSDRDRERAYEDDGQYSSRHLEQKSPEQNLGGPPSYEDVVADGRSPSYSERDGETKLSSPPASTAHETTVAPAAAAPPPIAATLAPPAATLNKESDGFEEFDPRGSYPAAVATSGGAEMDLFGSLSDSSSNALALVPSTTESATTTSEANAFTDSNPPAQTFVAASSASTGSTQPFNDPFGDSPFRAVPSTDGFVAQPPSTSTFGQSAEPRPPITPTLESGNSFGYGGGFDQNTDILADLLPPSGTSQAGFQAQPDQLLSQTSFPAQPNQTTFPSSFPGQSSFQGGQPTPQPSFLSQDGQLMLQHGFPPQGGQNMSQPGFPPHGGQTMPLGGFPSQMGSASQAGFLVSSGQPAHPNNFYGGFQPQGTSAPVPPMSQVTATPDVQLNTSNFYQQPQVQSGSALASSQPAAITASAGALVVVPQQPAKFETKSTIWADTLNRGLVDLNISGSKTNPLSNIGVDFEALNRKEKRMEKPSTTPMTSNVTMGKAMGSGSGIGHAGAGALRAQPYPVMGSSMGGAGAAPGHGAGYGGINQPMGQYQMQYPAAGFPPGSAMPGTYNPMMGGSGGYGQQPYGGSYR